MFTNVRLLQDNKRLVSDYGLIASTSRKKSTDDSKPAAYRYQKYVQSQDLQSIFEKFVKEQVDFRDIRYEQFMNQFSSNMDSVSESNDRKLKKELFSK